MLILKIYTIWKEKGTIDGLNILAVGDMRMRTMHSLSYAATNFDLEISYVSPPDMSLTDEFKKEILDRGNSFAVFESVEECIDLADVIYMEPVVQPDYTRSVHEKQDEYGQTPKEYKVTKKLLLEKAKPDAIILHSLPRMDELPTDVDETKFSRYWEEAFNGVVMRMSLLYLVLGAME